jgi:hypothetical protein
MRLKDSRLGHARARSRLVHNEDGIALMLALGVTFILALTVATVMVFTASGTRDAHRSTGTQKAYDLAEAGINNALAVLFANYPTTITFPGDFGLLSGSLSGEAGCGTWGTQGENITNNCTKQYASGTAKWTGTLRSTSPGTAWTYEWYLQAVGIVKNPTGPTSDLRRVATAIVPVVKPDTTSVNPNKSSIDWVYGNVDVTFDQSVTVASPVFAGRDLILGSTATIAETIPATPGNPAQPNRVVVTRNLLQHNVGLNQNHLGHVNGTVDPPASPNNDLGEVHIGGQCQVGSGSLHACVWGTNSSPGDYIFVANVVCTPPTNPPSCHDTITTGLVDQPSFSCCAGNGDPNRPILGFKPPVVPIGSDNPSDVGFWYQTADLGPYAPCGPAGSAGGYWSTGSIAIPIRFDRQGVAPTAVGADGYLDQSATAGINPFDLTPPNAGYDCISADGTKRLSWNGTNTTWRGIAPGHLKVEGTIFIDGSATSSADPATYDGKGAIILTGTFRMSNHEELCVNAQGKNCDLSATWDPNVAGLFIFAAGDFATERAVQATTCTCSGESIDMKQAQYQGGLFGSNDVFGNVTGTVLVGPIVSAYGSVAAGQSGVLSFPPIQFPSSGTDGFTGPLPVARLLAPRQFGGS